MATDSAEPSAEAAETNAAVSSTLTSMLSPSSINGYIDCLEKFGNMIRTKSEDSITGMKDPNQFSHLFVDAAVVLYKGIGINQLCQNIARVALPSRDAELRRVEILENIRGEADGFGAGEGRVQYITFSFANSNGKCEVFQFAFMAYASTHLGNPVVKYNYASMSYSLDFTLAPTMIFRHHSRKNYFREKSWDSIEYVPTHLSSEKMESIMCDIMPMFFAGTAKLLPLITAA